MNAGTTWSAPAPHTSLRLYRRTEGERERAMTVTCAGMYSYTATEWYALELWTAAGGSAVYRVLYSCTIVLSTIELFIYLMPKKEK